MLFRSSKSKRCAKTVAGVLAPSNRTRNGVKTDEEAINRSRPMRMQDPPTMPARTAKDQPCGHLDRAFLGWLRSEVPMVRTFHGPPSSGFRPPLLIQSLDIAVLHFLCSRSGTAMSSSRSKDAPRARGRWAQSGQDDINRLPVCVPSTGCLLQATAGGPPRPADRARPSDAPAGAATAPKNLTFDRNSPLAVSPLH